jgi:hypothetical protein
MDPVTPEMTPARTSLEELAPRLVRAGLAVGGVMLALSAALALLTPGGWNRFLQSYLVAFAFFLSLSLGALFFVLLQHLVRAGWSVVVRRLAETLAMNLPLLALFALPVLLGAHRLYQWADAQAVAGDAILRGKHAYLNIPFFTLRWLVYFAVWTFLARSFWKRSTAQDVTGDVRLTVQMERTSAVGMVLFALTTNYAAVDLLMSLDPHWYSTIFGVYFFSGGVVGFFALLSILAALLQRSGRLGGAVTDEHYHDLGKLVFAFTVFWAYIAFAQYMLIWYSNIPEETEWYLRRQTGQWTAVSLLLLFGRFLLPFVYLLPRFVKRSPKLFGPMAAWVLLMHYVDIYWLVLPQVSPGRVPLHLLDATCPLGIGGILLAAAAHRLRRRSLIPLRDPRLAESMAFENA